MENKHLRDLYAAAAERDKGEPEFLQALGEVLASLDPVADRRVDLIEAGVFRRVIEPERSVTFRVSWVGDDGAVHVNRGFRVQFNSAIGPYKGGIRFHPSVNHSIVKFLGFEQTFKNALTTLPLGGGKGGSDFDPKGKSDGEVMRFCQSFMTELYRHIGQFLDIPAGDTGVGAREIGYMYGQYKRICNEFTGAFTSKGISYGGSLVRTEATGYGLCYFTQEMLKGAGRGFRGSDVVISGSGNVAVFACQKAAELGAKVVAMSDSDGFVHDPGGIRLDVVRQIKEKERGRISLYADRVRGSTYKAGSGGIWSVPCSIALPCGTQNEIGLPEARELVRGGAVALAEGANMPTKPEAIEYLMGEGVLFGPGKAANAGGVTTSGLEMSQNSQRVSWTFDEVDRRLSEIMVSIHASIKSAAEDYGKPGNLAAGANIAGFLKVAEAMKAQGVAY